MGARQLQVSSRPFKYQWMTGVRKSGAADRVVVVLLTICEEVMQDDGMNVWASQAYIADLCGRSRKAVNEALCQAVKLGLIKWEDRADATGRVRRHMTPILPVEKPVEKHLRLVEPVTVSAEACNGFGELAVTTSLHKPKEKEPNKENPPREVANLTDVGCGQQGDSFNTNEEQDGDFLEQDAGQLALMAAEALGCSAGAWLTPKHWKARKRAENAILTRLRRGDDWQALLDALTTTDPPKNVLSMHGLVRFRATQIC